MAFVIRNAEIGWQQIATTSTTKQHPLGTVVKAVDPTYGEGEFIYLVGVGSTVVGSVVNFFESGFTTALIVADAIGQVGVAMSANVASQYGWYQIAGKAIAKCVASVADNGLCYACSTAGSIDDASTAGDRIKKAITAGATDSAGTGLTFIEIQYPFMDDGSAA